MDLYIATTNPGKLRDFRAAAEQSAGVRIEPLAGLQGIVPPEETGQTFEANARLKAAYYSRFAPGLWVLADDSGLEVDVLGGRPGVRSARFAMDVGSLDTGRGVDANNNESLLLAMLEETNRAARYRCALALACDGIVEMVAFGKLDGELLDEAIGDAGFGYDPLFFVPDLNCSMAEAAVERRLEVSHRGRALRSLLRQWRPC
jgi:XTP/dITP diphosphohydrolase